MEIEGDSTTAPTKAPPKRLDKLNELQKIPHNTNNSTILFEINFLSHKTFVSKTTPKGDFQDNNLISHVSGAN
jgi:hypothetical protein